MSGKYIAGQSLLVDTLTLESNLLTSQVKWVSTLDLSISFLNIYFRVLVPKYVMGFLRVVKILSCSFWDQNYIHNKIYLPFSFSFWYCGIFRGYMTYDKIIALIANGICICGFMCFKDISLLISNMVINCCYNPPQQKLLSFSNFKEWSLRP